MRIAPPAGPMASAIHVTVFVLLGAGIAAAYAAALALNTRLYLSNSPPSHAVLVHLARTTFLLAALVGLALLGWPAFVAAFCGFVAVHSAILAAAWRRV